MIRRKKAGLSICNYGVLDKPQAQSFGFIEPCIQQQPVAIDTGILALQVFKVGDPSRCRIDCWNLGFRVSGFRLYSGFMGAPLSNPPVRKDLGHALRVAVAPKAVPRRVPPGKGCLSTCTYAMAADKSTSARLCAPA